MKRMRIFLLLAFALPFTASHSVAAPGDTTVVQTFTFGSPQNGWFVFPSDTAQFERILMYYTLRCVPGNSPSCGEWDYLTYTYLWQHTGVWDSTITSIDTALNDTVWNVFEVVNRFELGRYITPYGIGLNLGNEGWTWVFDVTDYEPLLHDSVHLSAGNWQEQLDMKFIMVQGAPPREVIAIQNLWSGGHDYNAAIETQFLTPQTVVIDANAASAKLKIRTTGHGFGGLENCSEFCPRDNEIVVNGQDTLPQYLWRNDCGLNPLYPQGGTWVYDRANWCPGAEVRTDEYELRNWIVPGDSLTIDYNMQAGYVWDGQGSVPYYVVEGQLVTYGPENYAADVSLEEIIAPSDQNLHRRVNPICDAPVIRIRNQGSAPLTSVQVSYGPASSTPQQFTWTGLLEFMEEDTVHLPPFGNAALYQDSIFNVSVFTTGGMQDGFPSNDSMQSRYSTAQLTDSVLILAILSNSAGHENWWTLEDAAGNLIASADSLVSDNYSQDTFHLPVGCYVFTIGDRDGDGINFFASPEDGNGWLKWFDYDMNVVKHINPNFGRSSIWWFRVDPVLGLLPQSSLSEISVFPNPARDRVTISCGGRITGLILLDLAGREIARLDAQNVAPGEFQASLPALSSGTYLLQVQKPEGVQTEKLYIRND